MEIIVFIVVIFLVCVHYATKNRNPFDKHTTLSSGGVYKRDVWATLKDPECLENLRKTDSKNILIPLMEALQGVDGEKPKGFKNKKE